MTKSRMEIIKLFDEDPWPGVIASNQNTIFQENRGELISDACEILRLLVESQQMNLNEEYRNNVYNRLYNYIVEGRGLNMLLDRNEIDNLSTQLKPRFMEMIVGRAYHLDLHLLKSPSMYPLYESILISRFQKEFLVISKRGSGGFGSVFEVQNKLDRRLYAIKRIPATASKKRNIVPNELIREITVLASLQHENIVRYYSAWQELEVATKKKKKKKRDLFSHTEEFPSQPSSGDDTNSLSSRGDRSFSGRFDEEYNPLNSLKSRSRIHNDSAEIVFASERSAERVSMVSNGSVVKSLNLCSSVVVTNPTPANMDGMTWQTMISIQMELCDCTLEDRLEKRNASIFSKKSEIDSLFELNLFYQLVLGVEYMHSKNIMHRDIKPANIFLVRTTNGSEYWQLKLGDFGLSRETLVDEVVIEQDSAVSCGYGSTSCEKGTCGRAEDAQLTRMLGTALYTAPEILSKHGSYNCSSDLYSMGVVWLEMLYPFATLHEKLDVVKSIRDHRTIPACLMNCISQELIDQVTKLLSSSSHERPSALDILNNRSIFREAEQDMTFRLREMLKEKDMHLQKKDMRISELEDEVKQLRKLLPK